MGSASRAADRSRLADLTRDVTAASCLLSARRPEDADCKSRLGRFFQWLPFTVSACSGNDLQLNIKTSYN